MLFICAANTARSVMAHHILHRELNARGLGDRVQVKSAGIAPYARDGAMVSLDTRLVLRSDGIAMGEEATSTDLKRHPEMLEEADLVIAMTDAQARQLLENFPLAASRPVFTLRSFAGEQGDIDDPAEQGDQVFTECYQEIKRLIPLMTQRLLEDPAA
ncbi:MAG TPA: hypothetical protein VIX59_17240 [Candidatus Binataceae bacterium]